MFRQTQGAHSACNTTRLFLIRHSGLYDELAASQVARYVRLASLNDRAAETAAQLAQLRLRNLCTHPACSWAATPVSTKTPLPTMPPMPSTAAACSMTSATPNKDHTLAFATAGSDNIGHFRSYASPNAAGEVIIYSRRHCSSTPIRDNDSKPTGAFTAHMHGN